MTKCKMLKWFISSFFALIIGISFYNAGYETAEIMPYEISVIYKYQNSISAVDIIKNDNFLSTDDVLLVVAKNSKGETACAQAVFLDENLPKGTNEITVNDFNIEDNQKIFITIWDSIENLKHMTNGLCPDITLESERIIGNDDEWIVVSNGKRIVSYVGDENDVVIPNYINGKHITTVAPLSSQDNMHSIFGERAEEITSFKISDGIKVIGPTTFIGCKNASHTMEIPESITYIGVYAFYNCINIKGDLVIPDGVEYIYPASFAGCFEITSLTLPENLKMIGEYGFYGCKNLICELKMPESVSRIENGAFAYCLKMTGNLELPDVKYIGDEAFANCEALTGNLDIGSAEYVGNGAFATTEIKKLHGRLTLSDNLKYIGCLAFQNCNFTGILTLPDSLEHIGDMAFNHCRNFDNETLIIPENVHTLGGDYKVEENTKYSCHLFYDFGKDSKFKGFGVASGNKYFCAEDGVLYDIDKKRLIAYPRGKIMERYEIPEGVIQLDELSFGLNKYLKEIVLPDSYVIAERAPANVINQNGNTLAVALYNYTGVTKVLVKETNPNYKSVDGALYSKDGKSLWYCPVKIGSEFKVAEGTERMESGAIYGVPLQNYITRLEIPASVSYIAPETLYFINYLLAGDSNGIEREIIVHEDNPYYCVEGRILKAVE